MLFLLKGVNLHTVGQYRRCAGWVMFRKSYVAGLLSKEVLIRFSYAARP